MLPILIFKLITTYHENISNNSSINILRILGAGEGGKLQL
jgi:hypothetical protein